MIEFKEKLINLVVTFKGSLEFGLKHLKNEVDTKYTDEFEAENCKLIIKLLEKINEECDNYLRGKKELTTKRLKIYISGAITGDVENSEKRFQAAEDLLKEKGYEVINPFKIEHKNYSGSEILIWNDYMRNDIRALCECDIIYILKCGKDSKGSLAEVMVARILGIEIIYDDV